MRRVLVSLVASVMLAAPGALAVTSPDDPYFPLQWGVRKIGAPSSWSVSTGTGAIVAVVDTGVDRRHPDLKGRLLSGKDFANNDTDPTDDNGHGTLISGIIAANTDNGVGVAGAAYGAKILPVRVLGSDGTGSSSSVADGIDWAVQHGADVVNLSLAQETGGSTQLPFGEDLFRDSQVDRAIRDAAAAGAVVVIAAGNNARGGTSTTAYDATVPGVLVVGASTTGDARAKYSNYGPGLDLLAPGGGSPTNAADSACTQTNAIVSTWWNPKTRASDYGAGCGSSMAVGFVSAVAAQLSARGMDNEQVVDRILATAKDLAPAGRDNNSGAGRLDAARALGAAAVSSAPSPKPASGSSPARRVPKVDAASRPVRAPVVSPSMRSAVPDPSSSGGPGGLAVMPLGEGEPSTRSTPVGIAAVLLAFILAAHAIRANVTATQRAALQRAALQRRA